MPKGWVWAVMTRALKVCWCFFLINFTPIKIHLESLKYHRLALVSHNTQQSHLYFLWIRHHFWLPNTAGSSCKTLRRWDCVGYSRVHVICLLCVAFLLEKELLVHSILQGYSDLKGKKAFISQFKEMRSLWIITFLEGRGALMSHNEEDLSNFQRAFFTLMYTPL